MINYIFEVIVTDIREGDKLTMKKTHPCGNNIFTVLRIGMDFRISCDKCGRIIMLPRKKVEKGIKKIVRNGETV